MLKFYFFKNSPFFRFFCISRFSSFHISKRYFAQQIVDDIPQFHQSPAFDQTFDVLETSCFETLNIEDNYNAEQIIKSVNKTRLEIRETENVGKKIRILLNILQNTSHKFDIQGLAEICLFLDIIEREICIILPPLDNLKNQIEECIQHSVDASEAITLIDSGVIRLQRRHPDTVLLVVNALNRACLTPLGAYRCYKTITNTCWRPILIMAHNAMRTVAIVSTSHILNSFNIEEIMNFFISLHNVYINIYEKEYIYNKLISLLNNNDINNKNIKKYVILLYIYSIINNYYFDNIIYNNIILYINETVSQITVSNRYDWLNKIGYFRILYIMSDPISDIMLTTALKKINDGDIEWIDAVLHSSFSAVKILQNARRIALNFKRKENALEPLIYEKLNKPRLKRHEQLINASFFEQTNYLLLWTQQSRQIRHSQESINEIIHLLQVLEYSFKHVQKYYFEILVTVNALHRELLFSDKKYLEPFTSNPQDLISSLADQTSVLYLSKSDKKYPIEIIVQAAYMLGQMDKLSMAFADLLFKSLTEEHVYVDNKIFLSPHVLAMLRAVLLYTENFFSNNIWECLLEQYPLLNNMNTILQDTKYDVTDVLLDDPMSIMMSKSVLKSWMDHDISKFINRIQNILNTADPGGSQGSSHGGQNIHPKGDFIIDFKPIKTPFIYDLGSSQRYILIQIIRRAVSPPPGFKPVKIRDDIIYTLGGEGIELADDRRLMDKIMKKKGYFIINLHEEDMEKDDETLKTLLPINIDKPTSKFHREF
eukprot:GHVL01037533.1.p2 GENE.GHVL01037533.1~~GHVL01037533.1.p2  ORF type:complete len:768 (-),score=174.82 GHVL01037533.1:53-2356(-)